jgi:cob(I)alamin adenosyltransferase
MAIYTRSGDAGETSLAGGERVHKADARVEAYGTIDEANSCVGFARAACSDQELDGLLSFAQQRLSNCAALIATEPDHRGQETVAVSEADAAVLERAIDDLAETIPPLQGFVLPGGSELAARLHVARSVVRRAERRVAALDLSEAGELAALRFLNRLSDLLFTAARSVLSQARIVEELWDPAQTAPRR